MPRLVVASIAVAACVHTPDKPMTWPTLDPKPLEQSAATYSFRLGVPVVLAITPDAAVLFRRTPPRSFVCDLYELDTKSGRLRTLACFPTRSERL